MTNVEALKELYVALGGEAETVVNVTTNAEMINAITALVTSGKTAELPAVKAADNGKLLTVVSGKWAKADAPTELPAVTASNNGSVLKVIDGAWAIGTDNVE